MPVKMIYHVPYALNYSGKSGSAVRPVQLLAAFRNSGFTVDVVEGPSSKRARQIKTLKKRIRAGEDFCFVYSESHTMPTSLTDSHHLPIRPLMDLRFLAFCRQRGIPVGLFYRDIYWRFPEYRKRVNAIVAWGTKFLYNLDLLYYHKSVDVLYLPSILMGAYVPHFPRDRHAPLPPGGNAENAGNAAAVERVKTRTSNDPLELLYVGGLGGYYDLRVCLRAVNASKNARLTICTRESDWVQHRMDYEHLLTDRITVVHLNGAALAALYARADICVLFMEPNEYRAFAAPIKFAEYISYAKPVIVNESTNAADFVNHNNNGWVIPHDVSALVQLLDTVADNRDELDKVRQRTTEISSENTWEARAGQVAFDLTHITEKWKSKRKDE